MTREKKRTTAVVCIVGVAILSLLLLGANRPLQTATVSAGTLREQVVARATIAAADGIARVGAPAGNIRELRVRVGDVVKEETVLAVVKHLDKEHEVRAPIAGTIVRVMAARGDDVTPGRPLLEMARLDRLEAQIEVDAVHARLVAKGREVTLRPLGGGDAVANGAIGRVAPTVGPRTIGAADARIRAEGRVVTAWLPLESAAGLVLGQELEAVLILDPVEVATLLPHAAITIVDGHAIVRTPGRLRPGTRRVTLGRSDADLVEVLDLPAGTVVIVP